MPATVKTTQDTARGPASQGKHGSCRRPARTSSARRSGLHQSVPRRGKRPIGERRRDGQSSRDEYTRGLDPSKRFGTVADRARRADARSGGPPTAVPRAGRGRTGRAWRERARARGKRLFRAVRTPSRALSGHRARPCLAATPSRPETVARRGCTGRRLPAGRLRADRAPKGSRRPRKKDRGRPPFPPRPARPQAGSFSRSLRFPMMTRALSMGMLKSAPGIRWSRLCRTSLTAMTSRL